MLDSSQLTEVGRADGGKSLDKLSFAVIPLFPSHSSHLKSGESMMIVLESTVAGCQLTCLLLVVTTDGSCLTTDNCPFNRLYFQI